MAKKILVPVFPSEWFYDACIRAADIVAEEGGLITFAFCRVRPPESAYDMVILSHGYFDDEVIEEESTPQEVAAAVQEIGEVQLVVC